MPVAAQTSATRQILHGVKPVQNNASRRAELFTCVTAKMPRSLPLDRANVTLPQRGWSHTGLRPLAMTSRTRFLITAAFVCHLLLAPTIVTSQLLSSAGPADTHPLPSAPSA